MSINLRQAVLCLIAGSMFATSAQAGHFGSIAHLGGSGMRGAMNSFARVQRAAPSGLQQFQAQSFGNGLQLSKQSLGQRFSPQNIAHFQSGPSGRKMQNAMGQGQGNLSKIFAANQSQNGSHSLMNKLTNNASVTQQANAIKHQSFMDKLTNKTGATQQAGATGSQHQSFMDKLSNKFHLQQRSTAATNATSKTGATTTQTPANALGKKAETFGLDSSPLDTSSITNFQNQINAQIGQMQAQAQAQAQGPAGGTPAPTGGNTGTPTTGGAGNVGGAGAGGMGGATGGTPTGNTGGGMGTTAPTTGGGMGTTTPTTGGGFGNFGGGFGLIPSVIGAIASNGYYGGGYGGGYSAPVYSAPQYVEEAAPEYAETPAPQYVATPAPQATVAPASQVEQTASTSSPVIEVVEPLQGAQSQVLVRGSGFGNEPGTLYLNVNGVKISLEATTWTPGVIIAKVPTLNIASDATVRFTATRTDGASSQPYDPAGATAVASN